MSVHDLLLLLHLLLFCYWLGGDLGVFYASKFVVDPKLSREARLTAGRVMLGCDLAPRVCMSLMLTVGGLLSVYVGVTHPPWLLAGILLLGPVWLGMVLVLHFRSRAAFAPALAKVDYWFRWALIGAILASCLYAEATGRLDGASWLQFKLLAFAFLIFCGLMVRVHLSGFSAAYGKLLRGQCTPQDDARMGASLARVRPWVVVIWLVLVIQAALGVVKPGDAPSTGWVPPAGGF